MGFFMTNFIVLLFTFVNPPFHLWITASSPRFTILSSPVVETIPSIIIRRLENKFDGCHLSLLDHLDQKIRPKLIFFFTSTLIWLNS